MAVTILVSIKVASIYYSLVSVFSGLYIKLTIEMTCLHVGCNLRHLSLLGISFVSSIFTYSTPRLHDDVMEGLVTPCSRGGNRLGDI